MGCICKCHDQMSAFAFRGCCWNCEAEHDPLRNALAALAEKSRLLESANAKVELHRAAVELYENRWKESDRKRADMDLQVHEAREIILSLHKNPESGEAQTRAVKFLQTAVCQVAVCSLHWGRQRCEHVLPCPINDHGCDKCDEKQVCTIVIGDGSECGYTLPCPIRH